MTPLEALEIIKNAGTIYCGCGSDIYTRYRFEIETIENALKDYEYLKLVAKPLTKEEKKSINSVAKRLITFDIIKEHIYLHENTGLCLFVSKSWFELPEEKKKLVKEMLK